jgi:hypothetical protein
MRRAATDNHAGITYEEQQQNGGASIHSASANALPVTLDTLNIALPVSSTTIPALKNAD